ncbi:MAG: ABC transporter ATP-binding protein [Propionibacteriaceae bacterium]|jgi:ABC-type lipoprotein export system ATPase subunit|nr:ABC transporter ATP-binding protein [Propionibacteriaceae bacterium]
MCLVKLDGVGLEVSAPVRTRILHPLDLEIQAGSSVAVVGPSGAGKTTLASIIGALQPPSEGKYLFQGNPVNDIDADQRAAFRRDHIGFVFQNAHLIDERSAWRNVALGVPDSRTEPDEVERRSRAVLEQVGLGGVADRSAALLSGGERQRVAVARALVKQPDLMIADEPTGALDQASGNAILDLLFSLDTTLLMVTHDTKAASRARQLVTIVDGRIE